VNGKNEHPRPLGEILNVVAGRLRRVDLRLIDEVRRLWPGAVDPVLAAHCQPEFVKNGVLIIRVPSGAFAQRINAEHESILRGFSSLGEQAPTSIRTVLSEA
jgi:predicted nucleic acid-binding Zn ribbon protein